MFLWHNTIILHYIRMPAMALPRAWSRHAANISHIPAVNRVRGFHRQPQVIVAQDNSTASPTMYAVPMFGNNSSPVQASGNLDLMSITVQCSAVR